MSITTEIPQQQRLPSRREQPTPSVELGKQVARRHDLDALRAMAMLLGIVLHAALAFAPIPWVVNDSQPGTFYGILFSAIHGFRMPLFFLISGFFTAMLWRKRGLGGLIRQRLKRILLPLFVGCLTIVPAMWAVSILASQGSSQGDGVEYFKAAATGDSETLERAIQSKKIVIDALHPGSGASLLTSATFYGQIDTVEMLLEQGADVHQKNRDSGTALHVAVFMGRAEVAKRLLQAGADPETPDANGLTARDNLTVDFGTTQFIAQMYGQTLEQESLAAGRAEIAQLLGEDSSATRQAVSQSPGAEALYGLLFQLPVFMHLWFLAFLCWLVVIFMGYSLLARRVSLSRIPHWIVCSPFNLIWLVPLTMLPQYFMTTATFGPDDSVGLLPIPSVLAYYAIFFFFGSVYWDMDDQENRLGRHWRIMLPLALLVVLPLGLDWIPGTLGWLPADANAALRPLVKNFCEALFAWLMVFGSIGMFRTCFSGESPRMRYLSDSSYWLYLAHLPLVILGQWLVKDLPIPAVIKFAGIIVVVSAVLLVSYEYLIRYSFIGSILNGPRKRARPRPQPASR